MQRVREGHWTDISKAGAMWRAVFAVPSKSTTSLGFSRKSRHMVDTGGNDCGPVFDPALPGHFQTTVANGVANRSARPNSQNPKTFLQSK